MSLSQAEKLQTFLVKPNSDLGPSRLPPGNALSTAASANVTYARGQAKPIERGVMRSFLTTYRGGPNIIAPPPPPQQMGKSLPSVNDGNLSRASEKPKSEEGGPNRRSLDTVWRVGLFDQAEALPDIDPKSIGTISEDGKMTVLKYQPERFEGGRVHRPKVEVSTIDVSELSKESDGAIMNPKLRRQIHESQVNARQGLEALKDARRRRGKMQRTCAMNYPHGALGCDESPYDNPSDIYASTAETLNHQCRVDMRKGKGGYTPPVVQVAGVLGTVRPELKEESEKQLAGSRKNGLGGRQFRPKDSLHIEV